MQHSIPPRPPLDWPKACTVCGKSYSEAQWDKLPLLGYQNDDEFIVQMKNCPCGATLAVEWPNVKRNPPEDDATETWARGLLHEPTKPGWRRTPVWRETAVATPFGVMSLVMKRRHGERAADEVLWFTRLGEVVTAAGTALIFEPRGVLEISSTAVARPYRREGLYRAILGAMRGLVGRPMESDSAIAPGARKAWRYAGGVETKREGVPVMRINPSRKQ